MPKDDIKAFGARSVRTDGGFAGWHVPADRLADSLLGSETAEDLVNDPANEEQVIQQCGTYRSQTTS